MKNVAIALKAAKDIKGRQERTLLFIMSRIFLHSVLNFELQHFIIMIPVCILTWLGQEFQQGNLGRLWQMHIKNASMRKELTSPHHTLLQPISLGKPENTFSGQPHFICTSYWVSSMRGFICTFSLLVSLSFTFQSSKFNYCSSSQCCFSGLSEPEIFETNLDFSNEISRCRLNG